MEGVKRPQQDGWLWTSDQESYHHVATLDDAIAAGVAEAVEDWDGCGAIEVFAAYRVDLAAAAHEAAETAIGIMGNGALESAYSESLDELEEIQERLRRAFAADIERVCGPWYEMLGPFAALKIHLDAGTIGRVHGPRADEARAAGWTEGRTLEGFNPGDEDGPCDGCGTDGALVELVEFAGRWLCGDCVQGGQG